MPQSEIEEAALFEELPAFLRGAVASHLLRDILPSLDLWQVGRGLTCRPACASASLALLICTRTENSDAACKLQR